MNLKEIKQKYDALDNSMYGAKNIVDSLAMLYHENSKFNTHSMRKQGEKIYAFSNPYIFARSSQPFKCYPNAERIDLSVYQQELPEIDMFKIMRERRSLRMYNPEYKLSLNELNIILHQSYGVQEWSAPIGSENEGKFGLRNVPSGGGLYPLEMYVVILNAHIPSGLYHFRPDQQSLEVIKEGDFAEELLGIVQAEPYVKLGDASAVVITTGMIERVIMKYGDRGYRFLMQESGFVGMQVSLITEGIGLGSCMLGGYNDDFLNEFLGIDGVFETVNNVITIGGKPKS
ncbi:SagB family peptide dehydrogenase [Aureivirga marina]|uniref:SagB family peptide dehydrogenase n=1 Tax=Aureivirga marina TaxID=1182451 RepID=UPI0018C946F8|nr:SagB family peptide dehydrogenase [Aureivirga marina]